MSAKMPRATNIPIVAAMMIVPMATIQSDFFMSHPIP